MKLFTASLSTQKCFYIFNKCWHLSKIEHYFTRASRSKANETKKKTKSVTWTMTPFFSVSATKSQRFAVIFLWVNFNYLQLINTLSLKKNQLF